MDRRKGQSKQHQKTKQTSYLRNLPLNLEPQMLNFSEFYKPIDVAVHPDDLKSDISEDPEFFLETENDQEVEEPVENQNLFQPPEQTNQLETNKASSNISAI